MVERFGVLGEEEVMAKPIMSAGSFRPGMPPSLAIMLGPAFIMDAADDCISELISSSWLLSSLLGCRLAGCFESFPFSFEVRLSLLSRIIKSSLARVVRSSAPPLVSCEEAELVVRLVDAEVLELVTWNTEGEIGEVGCSGREVDFLILMSGMVGGGGRVVLGCGLSATGAVDGIRTISSAGRLSMRAGWGATSVILVTLIDEGGSSKLGTDFFVAISLVYVELIGDL